jgi:biopolymer transport protein ExbB
MNHLRTTRKLLTSLLAALLAFGAGANAKDSWWNSAWPDRRQITIDTTGTGTSISEPIGGATVLVRLSGGDYPTTANQDDLRDLRFIADDNQTVLPHHVEKMDTLLGEAYVWVKLPEVKANAKTTFWLYFGSTDPAVAKTDDPKACYDADTALAFHFAEAAGGIPGDSTKNSNAADAAAGRSEGSQIGSGVSFNGKNAISIVASPSLQWTGNVPLTVSLWVLLTGQPENVILSRRDGGQSFVLGSERGIPFVEISGQRAAAAQAPQSPWVHLAAICEGAKTTLYVNGELAATVGAGISNMNSPIRLGGDTEPGSTDLVGEIDELQIHKVARLPGFIQFTAYGQGGEKAAKLVSIGAEERKTNWLSFLTTGHFGVIIKNLTPDGWAVIVILMFMAVMSWYVMVSKTRYLNGISNGNQLFMEQWRYIAADLTVLDDDDAEKSKTLGGRVTKENSRQLRRSSVYRIYHIGVEEIRHRLSEDRAQGIRRGLAGRSIQAIRAALDGGLVRETQKINSLIVLLTICISGGPFLGLLGTVIGVMITFAAVAAAGEVNVNAIAPGIAAALLATVAGLAVAIPALFGYNYILSRVKDAKDDMHIFIDEFVTKMAEFYKE